MKSVGNIRFIGEFFFLLLLTFIAGPSLWYCRAKCCRDSFFCVDCQQLYFPCSLVVFKDTWTSLYSYMRILTLFLQENIVFWLNLLSSKSYGIILFSTSIKIYYCIFFLYITDVNWTKCVKIIQGNMFRNLRAVCHYTYLSIEISS